MIFSVLPMIDEASLDAERGNILIFFRLPYQGKIEKKQKTVSD